MDTIQQIIQSVGLDQIPPDILSGIGILLVAFVLWRLAAIQVKTVIGVAVLVALGLAGWHAYLWFNS